MSQNLVFTYNNKNTDPKVFASRERPVRHPIHTHLGTTHIQHLTRQQKHSARTKPNLYNTTHSLVLTFDLSYLFPTVQSTNPPHVSKHSLRISLQTAHTYVDTHIYIYTLRWRFQQPFQLVLLPAFSTIGAKTSGILLKGVEEDVTCFFCLVLLIFSSRELHAGSDLGELEVRRSHNAEVLNGVQYRSLLHLPLGLLHPPVNHMARDKHHGYTYDAVHRNMQIQQRTPPCPNETLGFSPDGPHGFETIG